MSERAESVGILVMKSGIVRSNTRRVLSEKEFRGFALADPVAPVVFVNGKDATVATVFTLAHELAHIWLGESGVTDTVRSSARGLERLCNRVAAELLVPMSELIKVWTGIIGIDRLVAHFRVSRFVIAIRALELGLINDAQYDTLPKEAFKTKKRSGGNGLANIPIRNSKRLTRELVANVMAGRTLIREAAALLNVRPDTVMTLGKGAKE
jgi:Zn-dependent peptidase ImmA (M78 family)